MNPHKIAILVDSGTDVPMEDIKAHGMYLVPLTIIYRDKEYKDKLEISAQEVYDRLETEVPRTSLPSGEDVMKALRQIKADGYQSVLAIAISSALSGTYNMLRLQAEQAEGLDVRVIDTRSIGFGAGAQALLAASLIEQGLDLDTIVTKLEESVRHSRVFFCLSTLEYLSRGGRIGKVAALVGSLLKLKPIITCNEEGAYVVASKVRGRAQAITETIRLAVKEARKHVSYRVGVVQGDAVEEARRVVEEIKRLLPNLQHLVQTDVSPALVVHTGPGLIGITVQMLPQTQ